MDKIILKAKNKDELDKMIKRTITLNENEKIEIKVIKKPKKILFFQLSGEYEIQILNKNKKENEHIKKETNKKEIITEQKKINRNIKKDNKDNKNNNKNDDKLNENKIEEKQEKDKNIDKIRAIFKEFIVISKLNIKIENIEKLDNRYVINIDGKDTRFLIGEKGSTLNNLEYLLKSIKELKNIKISINSNNYKEKREKSLKNLARKKAEKVLETGKTIKLNAMSARERKIIHEEISKIDNIKTESIGEEPKRYILIKKV